MGPRPNVKAKPSPPGRRKGVASWSAVGAHFSEHRKTLKNLRESIHATEMKACARGTDSPPSGRAPDDRPAQGTWGPAGRGAVRGGLDGGRAAPAAHRELGVSSGQGPAASAPARRPHTGVSAARGPPRRLPLWRNTGLVQGSAQRRRAREGPPDESQRSGGIVQRRPAAPTAGGTWSQTRRPSRRGWTSGVWLAVGRSLLSEAQPARHMGRPRGLLGDVLAPGWADLLDRD